MFVTGDEFNPSYLNKIDIPQEMLDFFTSTFNACQLQIRI